MTSPDLKHNGRQTNSNGPWTNSRPPERARNSDFYNESLFDELKKIPRGFKLTDTLKTGTGLKAAGEPFFQSDEFPESFSARNSLVLDYLKKQNLILNNEGGLRTIHMKLTREEKKELRERCMEAMKALFYHCPFQALHILYEVIPRKMNDLRRNESRINPAHRGWMEGVVGWITDYPETKNEVKAWITSINNRTSPGQRGYLHEAHYAARFIEPSVIR